MEEGLSEYMITNKFNAQKYFLILIEMEWKAVYSNLVATPVCYEITKKLKGGSSVGVDVNVSSFS